MNATNPHAVAKGGRRADLGDRYFRSNMEANYARYLRWLVATGNIRAWEYEPRTFHFAGVLRNPISYTPDFLVTENGGRQSWYEVKGWMDSVSRSKLKRMAKFYPAERVIVVDVKSYRSIAARMERIIPEWEGVG